MSQNSDQAIQVEGSTPRVEQCNACGQLKSITAFAGGHSVRWGAITLTVCNACYGRIADEETRIAEVLPDTGAAAGSTPASGHRAVPTLRERVTEQQFR